MRAWEVARPGGRGGQRLRPADRPIPVPGPDELLVKVIATAVCRTDLHIVEGDLEPHLSPVIPGHEVVGEVTALGQGVEGWVVGQRAGIAWLRYTCGECVYCGRGDENLCPRSLYTGWDADGGFAEFAVVRADYAYRLPERTPPESLAPLLCAGIIGYRALRRSNLPPGGRLGIWGFGASAHLAAQVAMRQEAKVHVVTRTVAAQELALKLGAASASSSHPPEPLDSAILFAPVGELVLPALEALDRGGTLAVAGIHLTDIPSLRYERHLFQERNLRSVTANTRQDGREFLALAQEHPLTVEVTPYPLDSADEALTDLANDRVRGVAVLMVNP